MPSNPPHSYMRYPGQRGKARSGWTMDLAWTVIANHEWLRLARWHKGKLLAQIVAVESDSRKHLADGIRLARKTIRIRIED